MTVKELYAHFSVPKTKFRCDSTIQIYDRQTCETDVETLPIVNCLGKRIAFPDIINEYANRNVFEWCVKAEDKNCFSFIIIVE